MKFKSNFFNDIEFLKYLWDLTLLFNKTALIYALVNGYIK